MPALAAHERWKPTECTRNGIDEQQDDDRDDETTYARDGPPDEGREDRHAGKRGRAQHGWLEARRRREGHDHRDRERGARHERQAAEQWREHEQDERDIGTRDRQQMRQSGGAVVGGDVVGKRARITEQKPREQGAGVGFEWCRAVQHELTRAVGNEREPAGRRLKRQDLRAFQDRDGMTPADTRVEPGPRHRREVATELDAIAHGEDTEPAGVGAGGPGEHDAVHVVDAHQRVCTKPLPVRIGHQHAPQGCRFAAVGRGHQRVPFETVERTLHHGRTEQTQCERGHDDASLAVDEPHADDARRARAEREWSGRAPGAFTEQQTRDHRGERDERPDVTAGHTRTRSRMSAKRPSPMPRTCLRSSTEVKRPIFSRSAHDRLGECRSDAGQRLQVGGGRGVEVERAGRCATTRNRRPGHGNGIGFTDARHRESFPVGDRRGEVQAFDVGVVSRTACRGERVAHPRAGIELHHTRRSHRADDVHERARWCRRRRRGHGRRLARSARHRTCGIASRPRPHDERREHHGHDHGCRDARIAPPLLQPIDERHRLRRDRTRGNIGIRHAHLRERDEARRGSAGGRTRRLPEHPSAPVAQTTKLTSRPGTTTTFLTGVPSSSAATFASAVRKALVRRCRRHPPGP